MRLRAILLPFQILRRHCRDWAHFFRFVTRRLLKPARISTKGVRLDLSSPEISPAVRAICYQDVYESSEAELARRVIRPDDRVLEIGAGIGYIASVVFQIIRDRARLLLRLISSLATKGLHLDLLVSKGNVALFRRHLDGLSK